MSESSFSAQNPSAGFAGFQSAAGHYQLSDDLARLCLPQEWKDSYRTLAWVNSICALFLVVGLLGLKQPRIIIRPLSEAQDVVPVIFTPPEEQPKVVTEVKPEDIQESQDTPTDAPQVATVVAVADPTTVSFAVPVQGAVAIATEARLATPPPPVVHAPPPKPTQFNPNAASSNGGTYPKPEYPKSALRNGYQGTVVLEFVVDASGAITGAKVQKSSGYVSLDEAAMETLERRWRFPAGHPGYFWAPFTFQLQ